MGWENGACSQKPISISRPAKSLHVGSGGHIHPNDKALTLAILDAEAEVEEAWKLDVRNCRLARSTKNSPQLLATNTDLETWA